MGEAKRSARELFEDMTQGQMTTDVAADLFTMSVRGGMAAAYLHANMTPLPHHAEMIRGEREITMRDIAEVAFHTNTEAAINLRDRTQGE